ncbi:MAG: protein disulfide oxidoreductase [Leptonema sp. (in: bacteria)]
MRMLNQDASRETKKILMEMKDPVKMILFIEKEDCLYCKETQQLLTEITELSDALEFEVLDKDFSKEKIEFYEIDKFPAIVLENQKDYGIRFYGIPSGYEYGTLLQDIIYVSNLKTDLADKTVEFIKNIEKPLHFQVFVTPTCPYCPKAVLLAHQFALLNDNIKADMVEATEFPELSNKYKVFGVPKTVINDLIFIEGAVPEHVMIQKLKGIL